MKKGHDPNDKLAASDVAREAKGEVTLAAVRYWADRGVLPSVRTAGGMRLFRRADVERVLADRRAARTKE